MASEAVTEAIDNLRQALIDDGMDEGTADAFLHAATPNEVNLVGNFADLNRLGAREAAGADEAFVMPASPAPGIEGGLITDAAVEAGDGGDLNSMTKAELQAEADSRGIDSAGLTKAELVAALEG